MWTLNDALPLIRKIEPIAKRHGFSLALYGSVLYRGESEKDLDLFFVEQEPDICDVERCLGEISTLSEIRHISPHGNVCVIRLKDQRHVDVRFCGCSP